MPGKYRRKPKPNLSQRLIAFWQLHPEADRAKNNPNNRACPVKLRSKPQSMKLFNWGLPR